MKTTTEDAFDQGVLAIALAHSFSESVTAFLTKVRIVDGISLGECYRHVRADSRGQFQDGHRIRTSPVVSAYQDGPYWCFRTLSQSIYVILTFSDGEAAGSLDALLQLCGPDVYPSSHIYH